MLPKYTVSPLHHTLVQCVLMMKPVSSWRVSVFIARWVNITRLMFAKVHIAQSLLVSELSCTCEGCVFLRFAFLVPVATTCAHCRRCRVPRGILPGEDKPAPVQKYDSFSRVNRLVTILALPLHTYDHGLLLGGRCAIAASARHVLCRLQCGQLHGTVQRKDQTSGWRNRLSVLEVQCPASPRGLPHAGGAA